MVQETKLSARRNTYIAKYKASEYRPACGTSTRASDIHLAVTPKLTPRYIHCPSLGRSSTNPSMLTRTLEVALSHRGIRCMLPMAQRDPAQLPLAVLPGPILAHQRQRRCRVAGQDAWRQRGPGCSSKTQTQTCKTWGNHSECKSWRQIEGRL